MRHNAVKHGLLAKQILFRTPGSGKEAFQKLLDDLERDYVPVGAVEKMLVEEIGACWWKLRNATRWELKGLQGHRQASQRVINELRREETDHKLLDSEWGTSTPQWECETLVIRSSKDSAGTFESSLTRENSAAVPPIKASQMSESKQKSGGTEIEATLKSSLPMVLRYETSLKRDLYRAIGTLEELQRRRKERHLRNNPK